MNVATGKTYKIGDNDVLALTGNIISIGGVTIDKTAGYITGGYWAGQTIGVNYGGTGFIDALGGITRKIVNTIATGATTTLSVNHGLTGGIVAQVYETGSGAVVECEIINSVAGTTTFNFNQIPTAGYYSYCIVG